ncbi:MAG TPA: SUMF1/EgtB/PvdO family nonheme iron enzyme [Puia sp.]|nr:SUMF1/EgtB/PvdO family nonheme iron enzyme [Puia sp.]
MIPKTLTYFFALLFPALVALAQQPSMPPELIWSADSSTVIAVRSGSSTLPFPQPLPLVSFVLNGKPCNTAERTGAWPGRVRVTLAANVLSFTNTSADTLVLTNPVPFGENAGHVYITGLGDHPLSRTDLFLPGRAPVNVIVPDNAWDMGYCSFAVSNPSQHDSLQLATLLRRDRRGVTRGRTTRFETTLYPGGVVRYKWYASLTPGGWRDALTEVFQHRMLYDTTAFDDSLFRRKDLHWIRNTYVMHILMTWDKDFYDNESRTYRLDHFLADTKKWYGGDDVVAIWPTWPTLGLDQRNQFDLFRDLPGGLSRIRKLSELCHRDGARFFICYNPWDESTRREDHFEGLSRLIGATAADGVVLDTKGSSSRQLQEAADRVRKGVIMYSEGMAVPKDMSGIVAGRVHNALYYPPMLNLNKLIKPEFAIYRVAELSKEKIRREFALAFFNGYGTELNVMAPGTPDWINEEYRYLGRTTRILRENTENFVSRGYTPLVSTTVDSIWVNRWALPAKTIYTIYSLRPSGYHGLLFREEPSDSIHFVDLWHHEAVTPQQHNGHWWLPAGTDAFNASDLGTNNEGEVDCIARLPRLLHTSIDGDVLNISLNEPLPAVPAASAATVPSMSKPMPRFATSAASPVASARELRIWAGDPAYDKRPLVLPAAPQRLLLHQHFGYYEGRFVIQLVENGLLADEWIVTLPPGTPRRISEPARTGTNAVADISSRGPQHLPAGMVRIPAGSFRFEETHGDEFIPYPKQDVDSTFSMPAFLMDRFPVTNADFKRFLDATHYRPADTTNFLRHWRNGQIPAGEEKFPVVNVSQEDAAAYAKWAGKRLPTELEWQYAAQTSARNAWPWQQTTPVSWKEEVITGTLTVKTVQGIDPSRCNLGNDSLYPVGKYPAGANPYGLQDLVGCVWQLTNDVYLSGNYRYIILKGGSYYRPSGSWWYVQGGPRELTYRQFLLRVSPGFERNATVGFRCVRDISRVIRR